MASLFERLDRRRTAPPAKIPQPPLAQTLLDWLQRWNKDTISTRDICNYGPRILRDQRKAVLAAEILAVHGWLTPLKTRQRNAHKWEITRKPIVHPTVVT